MTVVDHMIPNYEPRKRVLLSAHSISPNYGSELGIGWNIATRLARWHDVTVLCSPIQYDFHSPGKHWDARKEIAEYFRNHGAIDNLTFLFVNPPVLSRILQRESFPVRQTLYYVGYAAWQRAAYKLALLHHREKAFDIAHQLTTTGYREPSYLWQLDCPFVWGPISGATSTPWSFFRQLSLQGRLFYGSRNILNEYQKRRHSRVRKAAKASVHMWVVGKAEQEMVSDLWGQRAEPMLKLARMSVPMLLSVVSIQGKHCVFAGSVNISGGKRYRSY